jgi:hypothetical protein
MATFKRKSSLPAPPPVEEASPNLSAPETAPALPSKHKDGRTARRSNRTVQFATRVTPEFNERIRDIAERDDLLLVQVLELALEAYEASR